MTMMTKHQLKLISDPLAHGIKSASAAVAAAGDKQ